jgi:glycine betaine/proline transport system substrate-binding protein
VFAQILRQLGYQPKTTVLSVPVTFASMKNRDIDVFLGNWMPAQGENIRPFVADQSVEVLGANLTGARYTLAVPDYAYALGLHDFADIHRYAGPLNGSIYGIEPGNDGNRLLLTLIKGNQFGLGRSRALGARSPADRLPGLGSASDEPALHTALPQRR